MTTVLLNKTKQIQFFKHVTLWLNLPGAEEYSSEAAKLYASSRQSTQTKMSSSVHDNGTHRS